MKILHTADWHLGNVFHRHNRLCEFRHFLDWLLEVLSNEQPDALIIAGDLFDTSNPPASAEKLFYEFLNTATSKVEGLEVIIIAGNHDGAARLEAPSALLSLHRIAVRGVVKKDDKGNIDFNRHIIPLHNRETDQVEALCLAMPYLRTSDYPEGFTATEGIKSFMSGLHKAAAQSRYKEVPLIAAAHFYATGAEINDTEHSERLVVGGQDCVQIDALGKNLSYVALGHIHKAQRVSGHEEIRYSGSPLALSFSEKNYHRSIMCISLAPNGNTELRPIEYEPLRRLISIPNQGAATATQLLEAVDKLPKAKDDDNGDNWPYIELLVKQDEPDPSLQNELMERLTNKAVHYCRTVRVVNRQNIDDDSPKSIESLQQQKPIDLARKFYKQRFGNEMPENLENLFGEAVYEVNNVAQ